MHFSPPSTFDERPCATSPGSGGRSYYNVVLGKCTVPMVVTNAAWHSGWGEFFFRHKYFERGVFSAAAAVGRICFCGKREGVIQWVDALRYTED